MSAYAFVIVLDIVVLGLSASVNVFQDFFFAADLFPFLLSITTLVILLLQIVFDFTSENSFTARPAFEVPLFGGLTAVWLASNAFTTSRYAGLPSCSVFSDDSDGAQTWCRNAQGLRAIAWIEWLALFLTTLMLAREAIVEARHGNTAVWHTALSRYRRNNQSRDFLQDASSFYRGSSIFGFERASGSQKGSRDWFAPAEPPIRLSENLENREDGSSCSFFGTGNGSLGNFGNGSHSAVALQQPFRVQTPRSTKSSTVTKTVDGFEIISTGHYFQNEGIWGKAGPSWK